jgi:hypothetical protein
MGWDGMGDETTRTGDATGVYGLDGKDETHLRYQPILASFRDAKRRGGGRRMLGCSFSFFLFPTPAAGTTTQRDDNELDCP